jgi:hypothetical protein
VHLTDGFGCLVRYGQLWRGTAEKALVELGLTPPVLHQP